MGRNWMQDEDDRNDEDNQGKNAFTEAIKETLSRAGIENAQPTFTSITLPQLAAIEAACESVLITYGESNLRLDATMREGLEDLAEGKKAIVMLKNHLIMQMRQDEGLG